MKFNNEQIELFHKIAKKFNLLHREPHCSIGKQYFQIYPIYAPESEGVAGTHYEFVVRNEKINLEMHLEKRTPDKVQFKNKLKSIYTTPNTQALFKEDITYLNEEEVIKCFTLIYNKYENTINSFYKNYPKRDEMNVNNNIALNQILFGPPGTGKTFNTINRAVEIIDSVFYENHKEPVPENRKALKSKFEELSSAGQIEFVTFHQSYGYEEFVEGIKATTIDGNISYSVGKGIFKSLSTRALSDGIEYIENNEFNKIYDEYLTTLDYINDEDALGRDFKTPTGRPFKLFRNKTSFVVKANTTTISMSCDLLKRTIVEKEPPYYHSYVNIILPLLLKDKKIQIEQQTKIKNYILIIDEINRGNISKIFGELITLIEPSKRIGADEEIRVKLPYSNDELFGVPKNLYIIGTMNTADRSIALLDTALRRRFDFVEMMPKSELLNFEVQGISLKKLLETINLRVEYLYDRDHTIGHAYFMELNKDSTLDELNAVMKNRIIPLLQEYFYDDWEKVLLILGDGFVIKNSQNPNKIFDESFESDMEDDKIIYSVKDTFDSSAYEGLCQSR